MYKSGVGTAWGLFFFFFFSKCWHHLIDLDWVSGILCVKDLYTNSISHLLLSWRWLIKWVIFFVSSCAVTLSKYLGSTLLKYERLLPTFKQMRATGSRLSLCLPRSSTKWVLMPEKSTQLLPFDLTVSKGCNYLTNNLDKQRVESCT